MPKVEAIRRKPRETLPAGSSFPICKSGQKDQSLRQMKLRKLPRTFARTNSAAESHFGIPRLSFFKGTLIAQVAWLQDALHADGKVMAKRHPNSESALSIQAAGFRTKHSQCGSSGKLPCAMLATEENTRPRRHHHI